MKQKFLFVMLILFLTGVGFSLKPFPAFAASINVGSSSTVTCTMKNTLLVNSPSGTPACDGLPIVDAARMLNNPVYVQDTEAQTCAIWHISIDGAKPFDGCAEHMGGSNVGDYILFGPDTSLTEYQITALDTPRQNVAVTFIQKWIPDGTEHHPFLLLLYEGMCSDVWSVEGIGTDPLCTITMPVVSQGQYVEVAGADLSGEFRVMSVNPSRKYIVIG